MSFGFTSLALEFVMLLKRPPLPAPPKRPDDLRYNMMRNPKRMGEKKDAKRMKYRKVFGKTDTNLGTYQS